MSLHGHVQTPCVGWQEEKEKNNNTKKRKKEACDSPPTHSCLSGDDACLSPLLPPCPSSRTQPTQKQQTAALQPSKRWRGTVATGCAAAFTGYRESLRRFLSHGLSRRGRAPQSAHSGLRKESVAFISFFFFFWFYVRPFLWPYESDADMPQSGVFPRLES